MLNSWERLYESFRSSDEDLIVVMRRRLIGQSPMLDQKQDPIREGFQGRVVHQGVSAMRNPTWTTPRDGGERKAVQGAVGFYEIFKFEDAKRVREEVTFDKTLFERAGNQLSEIKPNDFLRDRKGWKPPEKNVCLWVDFVFAQRFRTNDLIGSHWDLTVGDFCAASSEIIRNMIENIPELI